MSDNDKKGSEDRPIVVRNTTDLQRLKLEKLMKNPDKPVVIPERPKGRSMPSVPDFVRNVMGSSAGAGSGEFHVYRHLRRKEYARQKFIQEKSEKERLNDEYHQRIEDNKRAAEEKTAKKRAKRQKRKQKSKEKRKKPKVEILQSESSETTEHSESENDTSEKDNTDNDVIFCDGQR
ncbi:uncharacterized protein CBL_08992 [Carabus blaptoides fortunei]